MLIESDSTFTKAAMNCGTTLLPFSSTKDGPVYPVYEKMRNDALKHLLLLYLKNSTSSHRGYHLNTSRSFRSIRNFPKQQNRFKNICVHTDPLKTTENAVVLYSRPIGGAWNSPKTEKKTRNLRIKLARCKQIDSRRRNLTQREEEKNG